MNDFYIYAYYEPGHPTPFYIGKGRENDLYNHFLLDNLLKDSSFSSKLKAMISNGRYPEITKLFVNLSEEQSTKLKNEYIERYGRRDLGTGCLCNDVSDLGYTYSEIPIKRKNGRPAKSVVSFNLETQEIVKKYDKMSDVVKDGFTISNVCKCCKGLVQQYNNLGWKYA